MPNKKTITTIMLCVVTTFLLILSTSSQISNEKSVSAKNFPTISAVKPKKNFDIQIEKEKIKKETILNDQMVIQFMEKLSKNDPSISILFERNRENLDISKKEAKDSLVKINEYIAGQNEIVDGEIVNIKRSKNIDSYNIKFKLLSIKEKESFKTITLEIDKYGTILKLK